MNKTYYFLILNIFCNTNKNHTIKCIVKFTSLTSLCIISYKIIDNISDKKIQIHTLLPPVNISQINTSPSYINRKYIWLIGSIIVLILYFIFKDNIATLSSIELVSHINNNDLKDKNDTFEDPYSIKRILYELENDIKKIKVLVKNNFLEKDVDEALKHVLIEKIKFLKQMKTTVDMQAIIDIYKYILMSLYAESYNFIHALYVPVEDVLQYAQYCYKLTLVDKINIPYIYDILVYYKTR